MERLESTDNSVITLLNHVLPSILRNVIKQLDGKSVNTKEKCFILLKHITDVLDGGLDLEASGVAATAATALRSIDSATSSSLAIAALSFLSSFFKYHSPRLYAQHLASLVPAIIRCMQDKLQRISFEGFAAASALAQSLRPEGTGSPIKADLKTPVKQLFDATAEVLGDASVDSEVRDRALDTLGNLLRFEGDMLASSYSVALPLISARLESEATASTAIGVIERIANPATSSCQGAEFEQWLMSTLPSIVVALRRTKRASSKHAEVSAISTILSRIGSLLSEESATDMIREVQPLLDTANGLNIVALVLLSQPAVRASVDPHLATIYAFAKRPGSSVAIVDALVAFFAAYTAADPDGATRTAPALVDMVRAQNVSQVGAGVYTATARIVGAVTKESLRNAAGILALFMKAIKVSVMQNLLACCGVSS
jgi:cullin-associated NEDD8-dissociated protein 1